MSYQVEVLVGGTWAPLPDEENPAATLIEAMDIVYYTMSDDEVSAEYRVVDTILGRRHYPTAEEVRECHNGLTAIQRIAARTRTA